MQKLFFWLINRLRAKFGKNFFNFKISNFVRFYYGYTTFEDTCNFSYLLKFENFLFHVKVNMGKNEFRFRYQDVFLY
jgi:hypothetical protein